MARAQIHLTNNHLTTQLLERLPEPQRALLEQLCTDSIYTLRDDFDKGINAWLWTVEGMALAEHDPFGVVESDVDAAAGGTPFLRSRLSNFYPNRRATLQTRAAIPGDGSQVEIGFVVGAFDQNVPAVVLPATGVTRGAESFGLAVRSPLVSDWSVVSGGVDGTNRSAATTRVAERGYSTFLVATNEQGETRLWVNGQHHNEFARQTDMRVTLGHFLWVRGAFAIDYIQAWQERQPL